MIDNQDNKKKFHQKPGTGSYKMYLDSKIEDTSTDIYYKTECKLKDSKVSIPTKDSVNQAKDWVDNVNKM